MAITTGVNSGERWVQIRYQATEAKVNRVLEEVARLKYFHNNGTDSGYDSLSNAEKFSLVDEFVRAKILQAAQLNMQRVATNTAIANADVETDI